MHASEASSVYSDTHEAASVVVGEVVREAYERTVRVYGSAPSLSLASLDSTATSVQPGAASSGSGGLSSRMEGDGSIMPRTVAALPFSSSEAGPQASDSHWNSVEMDNVDFAPLDGDGDSRWAMGSPLPTPSHGIAGHPTATKAPGGGTYLLMEDDELLHTGPLAQEGAASEARGSGRRRQRRKNSSHQPHPTRVGSGTRDRTSHHDERGVDHEEAARELEASAAGLHSGDPAAPVPVVSAVGPAAAGRLAAPDSFKPVPVQGAQRSSPPPSIHALAQRREHLQRIADFLVTNPLAASPAMGLLSPVKRQGGGGGRGPPAGSRLPVGRRDDPDSGAGRHGASTGSSPAATLPAPQAQAGSPGQSSTADARAAGGFRGGGALATPGTASSQPSRRRRPCGVAAGALQEDEVEGLLAHPENRVAQGLLATTQAVLQASRRADRRLVRAQPRHPAATGLPFSPGSSAGAPDVVGVGSAGSYHQAPWQQGSLASESGYLMASTVLVDGAMMSSEIGEGQGWGAGGLPSVMPSLPGVGGSTALPSGSRSRSSGGLGDTTQVPGGTVSASRAGHRRALGLSEGGRVSERSSGSGRSAVNAGMRAWDDAVASSVLAVFQTDVTRRVFLSDPEETSK